MYNFVFCHVLGCIIFFQQILDIDHRFIHNVSDKERQVICFVLFYICIFSLRHTVFYLVYKSDYLRDVVL